MTNSGDKWILRHLYVWIVLVVQYVAWYVWSNEINYNMAYCYNFVQEDQPTIVSIIVGTIPVFLAVVYFSIANYYWRNRVRFGDTHLIGAHEDRKQTKDYPMYIWLSISSLAPCFLLWITITLKYFNVRPLSQQGEQLFLRVQSAQIFVIAFVLYKFTLKERIQKLRDKKFTGNSGDTSDSISVQMSHDSNESSERSDENEIEDLLAKFFPR
eukprot:TRINITY_DN7461_c0_g1_i1.p1 TRINITY_DN7461_c0_g1~~TRINITY_DN7461_c0_g1_i1.p1  ORF type:complete len:212 (-),score=24.69 TRINITY_DN7461_c0_g1_i1:324-959(-)